MNFKKNLLYSGAVVCVIYFVPGQSIGQQRISTGHAYHVSRNGNDNNPGTLAAPFKSINKINSLHFNPGDAVYFKAGEIFKGTLTVGPGSAGSRNLPVIVSSYGKGKAIINGDSVSAISLYRTRYIIVKNLKLIGMGRKTGNRETGLAILNSEHVNALDVDISGFQKSGLLIDSASYITVGHVFAHDNGFGGITVEGQDKKSSRDIRILNCRAENNPGDPTRLDNDSGNGIVVGHCTNVLIDHCVAANNGWDMPRIGNGPVGIWCYEADGVIIQHCLSYQNKTSNGGADGGGFDLDGGTTNSVIQYCFSYCNQGSGYCIFQYRGASPFHNNIIRYNISENDGTVSDSQAGMYIWNSSDDPKQFYDCEVYGNIVYNSKVAALSFSEKSENKDFDFYHNIFVGKDSLIKGRDILGKCKFRGNDWWSLTDRFNAWGMKNFKAWAIKFNKVQKNGRIPGLNVNPCFKNPGHARFTTVAGMNSYTGYRLPAGSKLKKLLK